MYVGDATYSRKAVTFLLVKSKNLVFQFLCNIFVQYVVFFFIYIYICILEMRHIVERQWHFCLLKAECDIAEPERWCNNVLWLWVRIYSPAQQKLAFENNSRVLSATKGRFMSRLVFYVMPHGSAFMSMLQNGIWLPT